MLQHKSDVTASQPVAGRCLVHMRILGAGVMTVERTSAPLLRISGQVDRSYTTSLGPGIAKGVQDIDFRHV